MILHSDVLEIRGCVRKNSKKTGRDYLIVYVEEASGKSHEVLDRDVYNENRYEKGKKAKFQFELRLINRFITLVVKNFDYVEDKK